MFPNCLHRCQWEPTLPCSMQTLRIPLWSSTCFPSPTDTNYECSPKSISAETKKPGPQQCIGWIYSIIKTSGKALSDKLALYHFLRLRLEAQNPDKHSWSRRMETEEPSCRRVTTEEGTCWQCWRLFPISLHLQCRERRKYRLNGFPIIFFCQSHTGTRGETDEKVETLPSF